MMTLATYKENQTLQNEDKDDESESNGRLNPKKEETDSVTTLSDICTRRNSDHQFMMAHEQQLREALQSGGSDRFEGIPKFNEVKADKAYDRPGTFEEDQRHRRL